MKRKYEIIATSLDSKRVLCIDKQNKTEILSYVSQSSRHLKKFRLIVHIILEGLRNTDLYDKENINNKCKDVTAMKFFKGQENDRIYCKEQVTGGKYIIVAIQLHKKKSQKNTKKEISIIEKISSYEYEIE